MLQRLYNTTDVKKKNSFCQFKSDILYDTLLLKFWTLSATVSIGTNFRNSFIFSPKVERVGHILIHWKELILMFGILDNGQNVGTITTK